MQNYLHFILTYLICFFLPIQAQIDLSSIPSLHIHGINLITGEAESLFPALYQYEYDGKKVKKIIEKNLPYSSIIEFKYAASFTEVINDGQTKEVYHFNDDHLLSELEHYLPSSQNWNLYRRERLFWSSSNSHPNLIKRIIEDDKEKAYICYASHFNSNGQLDKETLSGNLSGACEVPLIIRKNNHSPLNNGIESYSIHYEYDLKNPKLLIKKLEDNGSVTHYQYDSSSKKCSAKLVGNDSELLSRYFYEYDEQGFLTKTIVDDGQSFSKKNLTGITSRKIMQVQSSCDLKTFGQPLSIENKFYDMSTGQEILIDRMICSYSPEGQLIRQDFYDANEKLKNSIDLEKNENRSNSSKEKNDQTAKDMSVSADSMGNETHYFYDPFGRLIETVYPSILDKHDRSYHPTLEQQFNILDQVILSQDQDGNITRYIYTIRNNLSRIDYPDGSFETYTYELDGKLKEQVERNGTRTLFSYDSLGRVSSKQLFSPAKDKLKELFYTYQGTLEQSVTDQKSFTIRYQYDRANRKIGYEYESQDGIISHTYSYDSMGKLIDPQMEKLNTQDISNETRINEETTGNLFSNETIILNSRNQFVKTLETHDTSGCKRLITYDALERPEKQMSYNSLGIKISELDIRHDAGGLKMLEKHYRIDQGKVIGTYLIHWEYDAGGRLIEICEGTGTSYEKKTHYHYNSMGQLEKVTQPNGKTLNYFYNSEGLLNEQQSSDGSIDYEYEYDDLYRLVKINDRVGNNTQLLAYNGCNQLIEVQNDEYTIKHALDQSGRCIQLTLPDLTSIRYEYDQNHLQTIERLGKDQSVLYCHRYEYDSENNGLSAARLIKNMGIIRYRLDGQDKVVGIISPWWSQSITENGVDQSGRILSTQIGDPFGDYKQILGYAGDGQVTTDQAANYRYDSLYNRLTHQDQQWQVNEINQLMATSHFQFIYDRNGNLVKKYNNQEEHRYSYDGLNRLIRYENDQKNAVDYRYDAFNRRLAEKIYEWNVEQADWLATESSHYLYDGLNEIGKMDGQGRIVELRILGQTEKAEIGSAIAIELKGRLFAPIHDIQGSVRCLIDTEDHSVAEFYRYSSFGEAEIYNGQAVRIERSALKNPWRYFSKRYDGSTQLVFFGLRYYDPSIARWTTPDPYFFCDTPNLYAFVKNDPINHYDLQGLFSISTLWNGGKEAFSSCFNYLKSAPSKIRERVKAELQLPGSITDSFEKISHALVGKRLRLLFGYMPSESRNGAFGEKELGKVRITFINGILSTDEMLLENLDIMSESHGGIKIHYIFRATNGWISDIGKAIIARTCYWIGYRSIYAHHLADTWRTLIEEMGGVNGGGIIIHYAHSLGGCDTDRARTLLSAEEQKMIRVFTFGSATMIRNEGFESVVNLISANDGVSSIFLEPLGRLRNYFDPNTNVRVYGTFSIHWYLTDHLLRGFTYQAILLELGRNFVEEFIYF